MSAFPSAWSFANQFRAQPVDNYDTPQAPRLPAQTGNPVAEYQTGQRTGDVSGLIGRQITETRQAQDANIQAVQNAINQLVARAGQASSQYASAKSGLKDNPNIAKLRSNIQSVLDNPDVLSAGDINNLRSVAESKRLNLLDAERFGINEDAAARGISSSGIRTDSLGQASSNAQSDIIRQILEIEAQAKGLRSDNLARAQGLSTNLETSLLGQETDLDKFFIGTDENRSNAIAQLLAGLEYGAPDYSGLASLGIGQFNANRQNDLVQGQLNQEQVRQYLSTYGRSALPYNRTGTSQYGVPVYSAPDYNEFLARFGQ